MNRIKSPEDISMDGAINLVADVLRYAYVDYKEALKTIMKLKAKYIEFRSIVEKYEYWCYLKTATYDIRNKNSRTEEEQILVNEYRNTPEPPAPTKEQKQIVNAYIEALRIKMTCEKFYKSGKYANFTLQKGMDGKDVIKTIREEVSWKEEENVTY